ncbi:unnamed protein product [Mucor circinelloides]|uniref:Vacuolar protein sorting-associated protein 27 n=1 Tax=Mucor circinelloides f. circinelloides (strain 1006PhL) TaxID=1220926 RepID=S2JXE4_MUCC1|nr:hypothetical protein HMPREF1544_08746 [Mucor circinelloides 1006PhL]KAG1118883.1 hypothetical protein G6F42_013093 [Rhizopus arrhizus]
MSWWGQSPFDEVVEKATSELLPGGQEDLVLNLDISDQIRSKKINAKDAMRSFKRRLAHKNPNVQLATLNLVDTCVKNGGDVFVKEIASREFMDELVSILKAPAGCNIDVKNKLLYVIQTWGLASKNKPTLSYMSDTYSLLKAEGVQFPPINENIDGILLETAAAPEWSDSDVCDRCRTAFTMTNRKHHCRNCGGTFCQQCSAKTMPLPKLGINEHVRVCDGCYIKLKLDKANIKPSTSSKTSSQPATAAPAPADKKEDDYDDDIKKAIELSLKEAEQQKTSYGAGYVASSAQQYQSSPSQQQQPKAQEAVEDDPDLAAAIAASLRDLEISQQQPASQQQQQQQNKNDMSPVEMENILLFSTLMDRVYATGGDVSNDTQINQLYTQIGALQPKLVKSLDETIRKRNAFIELHEKLNMAVKAYDRLLEERIAGVRYNNIPEQQYQQQPLYHQPMDYYPPPQHQDTNKYYPSQSAPPQEYYPQDYNSYQTAAAPVAPAANNQDMSNYYSAPPHYQMSPSHHTGAPPQPAGGEQQKQPVEEAPLIDL